jgi:hypothetical protein
MHFPIKNPVNGRVQRPEGLFRKGLNPLRCAGANARLWESSQFPYSEAVGRIRQLGVDLRRRTIRANADALSGIFIV